MINKENYSNLPKELAQQQFEEGFPQAGDDAIATEKIMTASMRSAQEVYGNETKPKKDTLSDKW